MPLPKATGPPLPRRLAGAPGDHTTHNLPRRTRARHAPGPPGAGQFPWGRLVVLSVGVAVSVGCRGAERNGERFFALASFEVNLQLENVKENCHTLYDASEVTLCRCGALLYTIRSSFVYNLVELFMYRRTQVTLCRCGALLYTIVELFVYRRC